MFLEEYADFLESHVEAWTVTTRGTLVPGIDRHYIRILPADQDAEFRKLWDEFEEQLTPESKFAAAIDSFQPMLLNCATQGAAWKRHGVSADRVVARNSRIAMGSDSLWKKAAAMIQGAVDAGHLAPGA